MYIDSIFITSLPIPSKRGPVANKLDGGPVANKLECDIVVSLNSSCTITLALGLVSLFNGISTFVGYLMPKPFS